MKITEWMFETATKTSRFIMKKFLYAYLYKLIVKTIFLHTVVTHLATEKVRTIKEVPAPNKITQLWTFDGLINY